MSSPQRRPPKQREGNDGGDGDDSSSDDDANRFLGREPHWGRIWTPGKIVVSSRKHRRLIEETDNADNPRIEFVGEAAESGADDSDNGGEG